MENSPSIDPAELERFRALADTWWQADGPFWPLHLLNTTRMEYLRQQFAGEGPLPFAGLRVLDVGCGGGIFIAREHAQANGVDVDYRLISAEQLAREQGEPFDLVLNMEVVEHVADLSAFMAACSALVKPGGAQVVATINKNPWAWFAAVFMAERMLRLLPVGTHQWAKLRTPRQIKSELRAGGCEPVAQSGVRVNPFARRMALTASMAINYMIVAKKGETAQ